MKYFEGPVILVIGVAAVLFGFPAEAGESEQPPGPSYTEVVSLLESWIQSIVDYDRIPGLSLAVVHDQEIVYARGFGHAELDREVKATPETVFGICSISKVFTGIAVMQLRDAGKLALDDPVSKHLGWFAPKEVTADSPQPTVRDLLRHTGGLPCEPDRVVWIDPDGLNPNRHELVDRVSKIAMSYRPGTTFNYSNLGYALLGEIVAALSGIGYDEYIVNNILRPLELQATSPFMLTGSATREVAVGYSARPRSGPRQEIAFHDQRAMTPAGGFASTVRDLATLAMWQFRVLDGKDTTVLSRESLREMQSLQWPDAGWGLGFTIWRIRDREFVGHQGGCYGFQSLLVVNTEEKIAAAVIANTWDAPQFTLAMRSLEILSPVLANTRASETERNTWSRYTGFYTSENTWSDAEILSWRGGLAVRWVPGGNPDPVGSIKSLTRVDGETFREVSADGNPGKHFVFRRDLRGNVVAMKFNGNVLHKTDPRP